MYGGIWYGGLTYGGTSFSPASLGLFNPISGLDACFDQALGYGGSWYAGTVYAGTPFCLELFDIIVITPPKSNVRDICIVQC